VFLGVDACDLEFGLSTPNVEESQVNQAMARIAREKILVADSSKFGKRSLSRIIPLGEIDVIVTDRGLPAEMQNELRSRDLELVLV
jgi:DeoR family transcriptional regulator of aga operon